MTRRSEINRETTEVTITGYLDLDGAGTSEVKTGLGFLDHMLATLARHGRFDLALTATGDTEVDDHHTVEDAPWSSAARWTKHWRIAPASPVSVMAMPHSTSR